MQRRTFLKIAGMSSASMMLTSCQKQNEKLIPLLVPQEDGSIPGRADYYASTCRQCPAGCGILVRVSEGRAKKIEGNPLHPVNRGKLCARGQAALQQLYHPDRLRKPLKRTGTRGTGEFEEITWEEAQSFLTKQLKALQTAGRSDQLALISPPLNGSLATLTDRFLTSFGTTNHLAWDLLNLEWLRRGMQASFGLDSVPDYDLENSQYILSFGADFLETHLSPVRYGREFGAMRQARQTIRGRFTYAGPRLSLTAASADRWLAIRPGTEGLLALGLARELVINGSIDRNALASAGIDLAELKSLLREYVPRWVSEATGISLKQLRSTANDLATIRPALVMAGETVAWQTNGLEAFKAVQLLNTLIGSIDQTGGVYLPEYTASTASSSYADLLFLISHMREGKVQLALTWQSDPVYSLPANLGFQEALRKVPFLTCITPFMTDTALQADLILPESTDLESWGDVIPDRGVRGPVVGLMQPVVDTLYETKSYPDILLETGRQLGGAVAAELPWTAYPEMLKATLQERLGASSAMDFDKTWNRLQQQGGLFEEAQATAATAQKAVSLPALTDARFAGDVEKYPLYLQVYPSPAFNDGRNANLPWLQQLPDPMSTAVWGSWVELNPATAARLGISEGDLVEVVSPQGRVQLPAVIYPGIHPDLLAIPLGQGHQAFGRYAADRGVNPLQLLVASQDETNALPAWGATRVRLNRVSSAGELVTAGHPEGRYRRDILGI